MESGFPALKSGRRRRAPPEIRAPMASPDGIGISARNAGYDGQWPAEEPTKAASRRRTPNGLALRNLEKQIPHPDERRRDSG